MNIKNVNPNKLVDELQLSGVKMREISNDKKENEFIAQNTSITFEKNTDMELVQQIIDAHDPTPLPELPTDKERIDMLENMILMIMEV